MLLGEISPVKKGLIHSEECGKLYGENTLQFWIQFHHPKTFLIETFNMLQCLGGLGTNFCIFRHAETLAKKILKNL
jgi:hypothetical protein